MRLPHFVASALLAAFPAILSAQITVAGGTVVDSASGRPIEGVLLSLSGNGYSETFASRADGTFRFSKVTPGTYTLVARRLGYAKLEMPIPIEDNGVRIRVSLVRTTLPLDTVRARTGTGLGGEVGTLSSLHALRDVEVTIVGVGTRVRTDSSGRFFVPLKNPGTYVVRARSPGYAPVAISVVVPRDSTSRLMLLMDTASVERSNAYELAWRDFGDRARMRGTKSAIVSQAELARTGELGLLDALRRVTSVSSRQLRFGQTVCVFVDGRPAAGGPLRGWDVEEVEAVEVYTSEPSSEVTGTLRRASRGYECQPTEMADAIAAPSRDRIRWLVIWTKQ